MAKSLDDMHFAAVYGALVAKAERKGKTRADVDALTSWLTGYSEDQLEKLAESDLSYADFIRRGPAYNINRKQIIGKICGVQIETITDPVMQEVRRLDKLVDRLAKGKSVEQVIAKYEKE